MAKVTAEKKQTAKTSKAKQDVQESKSPTPTAPADENKAVEQAATKAEGTSAAAKEPAGNKQVTDQVGIIDQATEAIEFAKIQGLTKIDAETEYQRLNDNYDEFVKQIAFVIPYLKSAAAGQELKYALRSIYNSYPECKVIIIGDKEDFFSEEIVHLQHDRESDNPQIDVTHKLVLGIASGEIEGDFILTNDDIFILGKSYLTELYLPTARGLINGSTGTPGGIFNTNALRTKSALEEKGLTTHNYGTHTPILLNAEILLETIEEFKADEEGFLLTSLYYNRNYVDTRPVQIDGGKNDPILASIYRQAVPEEVLEEALAKRKFLNVNDEGYKAVAPYLKKLYPDKSKFEK